MNFANDQILFTVYTYIYIYAVYCITELLFWYGLCKLFIETFMTLLLCICYLTCSAAICYLTCSAAEYMINRFVAPCVKTPCLIPAYLLALVIGFSALAVQNCYAGRFSKNFYRSQAGLNIMHAWNFPYCLKSSTRTTVVKGTSNSFCTVKKQVLHR